MEDAKAPLTFLQQADLLIERGMPGDRELMVQRLRSVSYYRVSGYAFPFRIVDPSDPRKTESRLADGTTFEAVWTRYVFDRRLRLLLMDAIERTEIAVRSLFATHHALRHGAFAYATDPSSLPDLNAADSQLLDAKLSDEQARSREAFAEHFRSGYGDTHTHLPIWMAAEVLSLGTLLTLCRGSGSPVRSQVAAASGVHEVVFRSWLLTLNKIRNICAHHGRVWNREFGVKPKIPHQLTAWHAPVRVRGDRLFGILTICKWCLDQIAPQTCWGTRVRSLPRNTTGIPMRRMGFADGWEQCPIWLDRNGT